MKASFALRSMPLSWGLPARGSLAVRSGQAVTASLQSRAAGRRLFADAAAGGTMAQIKELRTRTGAGVMDCKEALAASGGDPAKAEAWLLDKARARFAKKAERPTTEGALALGLNPSSSAAVLVEVNSETDFVGRLEGFQRVTLDAAEAALAHATEVAAPEAGQGPHHLEPAWLSALTPGGSVDNNNNKTVADSIIALFMQVGENMKVRRGVLLRAAGPQGVVGAFVQGTGLPNTGTLGALVALETRPAPPSPEQVSSRLVPLANALAKHVAGINPKYIAPEDAPAAEAKEEHVVLEQQMTYGEETGTVRELLAQEGAKLGGQVHLTHFVRWKVGEGLEKPTIDFAAEVEKEVQRSNKQ